MLGLPAIRSPCGFCGRDDHVPHYNPTLKVIRRHIKSRQAELAPKLLPSPQTGHMSLIWTRRVEQKSPGWV